MSVTRRRSRSFLALALIAVLGIAPQAPAQSRVPLSTDNPIGGINLHFADSDRVNPWTGEGIRDLAVPITYPTDTRESTPLRFPNVTSEALDNVPAVSAEGTVPVVLFTPGFYTPRYAYSALTDDLAARGYVVIAMDHTGETATGTLFPDGHIIPMEMRDSYSDETLKKGH